jgi:PDZ domain-containing protein
MSRRGLTFLIAAAASGILIVLAWFVPVPYVLFLPGPVTDTLGLVGDRPVVGVSGARTYPTGGHLYLTTVGVLPRTCAEHPTMIQALRAWFDHTEAIEPRQTICPPHETEQQVAKSNAQDMTNSQQDAITAALLMLGYPPTNERVIVGEVSPNAPADGVLEVGDVLQSVDGQAVTSNDRLLQLIRSHPVGTPLRMSILRHGSKHEVRLKTVDAGDPRHTPLIGITPDVRATFRGVHVDIGIDPNEVGGPSAGLAFALGIIDKLTPGELTGGRTIAGTGTIDGLGVVGPIGGIQQKILGAVRNGATVFLAPAANCADAKSIAPQSLTLVRVERLRDAVDALHAIASGSNDFPRC